jgi:co-chaperonin GroES (HSP10)
MTELIVPKHLKDKVEKQKEESEAAKLPNPTGWRLLLLPVRLQEKTKGGVYLTDDTIHMAQIAGNVCKVLKVGPSAYGDKDRFPDGPWCKEGDWVVITKYAGSRLYIDGGELRVVNDDEVIAQVDDPMSILPSNVKLDKVER